MASPSSTSQALNKHQDKVLNGIFTDSKNLVDSKQKQIEKLSQKNRIFVIWCEQKFLKYGFAVVCLMVFSTFLYFVSSSFGYVSTGETNRSAEASLKKDLNLKVKVLRSGGQPVAGARLAIDGENFGVTDTFGEWEKSVQIESAKDLVIKVSKPGTSSKNRVTTKSILAKDLQSYLVSQESVSFMTAIEIQP
jgi:hypothetical protein